MKFFNLPYRLFTLTNDEKIILSQITEINPYYICMGK